MSTLASDPKIVLGTVRVYQYIWLHLVASFALQRELSHPKQARDQTAPESNFCISKDVLDWLQ